MGQYISGNTNRIILGSVSASKIGGNFSLRVLGIIYGTMGIPIVTSNKTNGTRSFMALFGTVPGISTKLTTSVFRFGRIRVGSLGVLLGRGSVSIEV